MKNSKIVRIGKIKDGDIFLKIKTEDGKFSVSGVIGPKRGGDASGSCGQISMGFEHRNPAHNDARYTSLIKPAEIDFAPGWTAEKWLELLEIWHDWHLNNMRPGCEHMTGDDWNSSKQITLYHFRTAKHVDEAVRAAKRRAEDCLEKGLVCTFTQEETRLARLNDRITLSRARLPENLAADYIPNEPQYKGDSYNKPSEIKAAGWVEQSEHPDGILSKPCPVCGHKYGSAWRRVEVPSKVLEFVAALPDTDKTPAWV